MTCRRQFLAGFGAALLLAGAARAQASADALLDDAKRLRLAGQLPEAEQRTRAALKVAADPFRANYTLGLIQLDKGETNQGIATLNGAVERLKGAPAPDPTIYNTLGWALMGAGRFGEAKQAFDQGYAQRDRLPLASRQKLLNNMSLLARLQGQAAPATRYLEESARLGSAPAQQTLQKYTASKK